MVQQMVDSKFSEYALANSENGFTNHDKQLSLPVAARKTALRDLQNETAAVVAKSTGSPPFQKVNGPTSDAVMISGTKRPTSESLVSSPQKSLISNTGRGHLVYVRRKAEAELRQSSASENTSNHVDHPQLRKLSELDKETEPKSQMKDSKICTPEVAPMTRASPVCFSSLRPLVPVSPGKSDNILPPTNSNLLQATSSQPLLDNLKKINIQHLEERYYRLQSLLKNLDQSNQDDYVQMLRSLPSVELSRHAFELEKRSILLSLEEAKEMQRVRLLDVLGKYPKNCRAPSTQQDQSGK